MPERPMTMSDVARRAGVHPATVSRALRDDPRITPAQRAKVRRAAQELGYRTNPLVAALMTARRAGRPPAFRATIAYITKYPKERAARFARDFGGLLAGARERARAQGYAIEEFNLHDPVLTPHRASEILRNRGIPGLIVAPLHSVHESVQLDWAQFATVAIGYSLSDVPVTRVAHNHFHGLSLAARECRAAGCQRLGLVLPRRVHEKVDKRWVASLLLDNSEQRAARRVPPLLLDELDESLFCAWFRRYQPDAVLGLDLGLLAGWLKKLRCAVPRDVALVSLDRRLRDGDVAGIDQDYPAWGAAAVDLLVAMLHRNERGLPGKPATMLLDGKWAHGATLRMTR